MKRYFAAATLALALTCGMVTTAQAHHGDRKTVVVVHERHYHGHRFHRGRYVAPPGYYYRAWRHGDYLPRVYYGRRYIVHDYHVYRLRPPPRGYHWVRVDHDIVLAAIASGLVVEAVYGIFD